MQPETSEHPHQAELARLRRLAVRMDSAFRLPIIGVRVGWDAILGLVPGIGDLLALAPSAYILKEAHRLGAPPRVLGRMGFNTGVDLALGAVPIVGDLFDIGWKSKIKNVDLLERHLREAHEKGPQQGGPQLRRFDGVAYPTNSSPEKK